MANSLPKMTNRSADKAKSFAAGFGATNLTTVTGQFPNHGPQYSEAHNANSAANQSLLGTLEDGTTFTIVLAPGETRPVPVTLAALQVSGADISVACYWWLRSMKMDDAVLPTLNA